MTNLDSLVKSRDITLPTKVHIVNIMVFPVVMYGCESWRIRKAERWRTDAFRPWCWRTLLRAHWTARRSSQSILKESNPEFSLEGLKLRLQYFGHLMWKANSLEKTLAPWKKSYNQHRQHIKKQRHYFADKGLSIQSYGFSSSHVLMWELDHKDGWTPKNWCLWTVVLEKRRLLRVPWTAGRSNQSILKEINPEYSLEELLMKLKLQYFGHLMWRAN